MIKDRFGSLYAKHIMEQIANETNPDGSKKEKSTVAVRLTRRSFLCPFVAFCHSLRRDGDVIGFLSKGTGTYWTEGLRWAGCG